MQTPRYLWSLLLVLGLLVSACHDHDHEGHDHGAHAEHDDHESETAEPITYTFWKDSVEALIELMPLVKGEPIAATVILTNLATMQPLQATVQWQVNRQATHTAPTASAGIYTATFPPPASPIANLSLQIQTPAERYAFALDSLPIASDLASAQKATYPSSDVAGSIVYPRPEWWGAGFALAEVERRPVGTTIHTSGMVEPANSNLLTVVAGRSGVVSFRQNNLTSGRAVQAGTLLFSIAGKGIVSDDLEMNYLTAQSNLDRQRANLDRKRQLLDDNIIGQREYDEARNSFEVAEAEFNNIQRVFAKGSKRHLVTAPSSGYLAQVAVRQGEFVEAGQRLATVLQTKRLQVRVDVSPRYGHLLPQVVDANFVNPYTDEAYSLADLEGTILSFGKMTSHEEGHYLPFYFEVNNHPALLPGTLVEVYLQTQAQSYALTIPASAVLEEMGSYVVFVQRSGETYDKQVVELGSSDGKTVQITRGLAAGDRVVSRGALRVKLAAMAESGGGHDHHGHAH